MRKAVRAAKAASRSHRRYQLHIPDRSYLWRRRSVRWPNLQSGGKIRLIGLSNVTREHIERARRIVPIVSVQNRYSFADREWDYVVDYCERNGIVFIPWFPLGAGKAAKEAVQRMAEAHNAKPMQVALAWLLQRSPLMLPIPGTSSVAPAWMASSLRVVAFDGRRCRVGGVEELKFTR
jgi:aryl-alcohol dehydrogenase-like predicted oxidoreductase